MDGSSKPPRRTFAVIVLAALIILAGFLLRPPSVQEQPLPDKEAGRLVIEARQAGSPGELRQLLLPPVLIPKIVPVDPVHALPATDRTATSSTDPGSAPVRVAAAFASMPSTERTHLAERLVAELTDDQFPRLVPLLTQPNMPEEVLDVLMADALGRRSSLSLPAMLEVNRVPDHPKAEDAFEILQLYLDADYGDDWAAWETALNAWLAANPDL